jgi:hypothetical protein
VQGLFAGGKAAGGMALTAHPPPPGPPSRDEVKGRTIKACSTVNIISTFQCQRIRISGRLRLKCDVTRTETRFRLSAKRTSPFKSAGASVQSTTGSRGVRISGSNAGYTMFRGSVKSTGYPLQFPLHFPSRASPCAVTFQLDSTS